MITSSAPVSSIKLTNFSLTVSGLPTIVAFGSSDCSTAAFSSGVHICSILSTGGCSLSGLPRVKLKNCCWIDVARSEEHTSELQSRGHLVCRLLLEKKKK